MRAFKDNPSTTQETEIQPPTMFRENYLDAENVGIPKEVREKNSAFRKVENAINSSRQLLEKVERVRQADLQNERLTETGRRLETWKFWKQNTPKFMQTIGAAQDAARDEAESIDKRIKNGLRRTAKNSQLSLGIWQILREMPEKEERISYIRSLINDAEDSEDRELVEIVLGSNPQLTGIDREARKHLRGRYEKKYFSEDIEVRDGLLKAVDLLERGYNAANSKVSDVLYTPELRKIEEAEKASKEARLG